MATLKRWESPRRKGRNDKGRGGSARQRQLKKRGQQLRKRLKADMPNHNSLKERSADLSFLLLVSEKTG